MADRIPGIGGRGGRGAIIAKVLEMQRAPGQPPAPPAGDGTSQPSPPGQVPSPTIQPPPPRLGGRGALMQRLLQGQPPATPAVPVASPGPSSVPPGPSAVPPGPSSVPPGPSAASLSPAPSADPPKPKPMGRGMMMELVMARSAQTSTPAPTPTAAATAPAAAATARPAAASTAPVARPTPVEDVTRRMKRLDVEGPTVVRMGSAGRKVDAVANYIPLYLQPGRGIFEYEVRISPPVDDRPEMYKMIFDQNKEVLGIKQKTFDGVTLYIPFELKVGSVTSTHSVTKEEHQVSFIFRKKREFNECLHFYNVLFNNIQRELKLTRLGREYYNQELAHYIPQHRLEIWPGYVTAVDAFEGGIMLNCNASHKVLRSTTVLKLMDDIIHQTGGKDWKEVLQKQLIGQSVMTRKPVKIYRIDDIDFSRNPTSTFVAGDGKEMTFVEYHERRSIEITDMNQPLLVHRPKPSKRPVGPRSNVGDGLLMLVPELCSLTGLTDEMRSDFKVMKDVAVITRVNPNQRIMALQKFIDNIKDSPRCVEMLDGWGLKVPVKPLELTARILDPEKITFGRGFENNGSPQADWTRDATNQHMLVTVNIYDWIVLYTPRDQRNAEGFVEMMGKVCPQMGVTIQYPTVIKLRDDKPETYLRNLRDSISEKTQLAVVIFPTQREDRYSTVKKVCCVEKPIPSQVINGRTISRPDKLRSIVQKIALQINCKLGGSLWKVKMPLGNAMICGLDTYHDSKNKSKSVVGFVTSMNKEVTRWYSQVFVQSSQTELLDGFEMGMGVALHKYNEVRNCHPDQIVVFRDGVGDGQLKTVQEHEISALTRAFQRISPEYNPSILYIICQKRINTRIFIPKGRNDYENPPPGSVVDHTVTRRTLFDFFLVSQFVRQGTVTPTHYVVLHNTTSLDPDKIQKLTYKMCHLYYNWPGTVRVPAPCQYAHKLAHLVGTSIHKEPSKALCDKLFFL